MTHVDARHFNSLVRCQNVHSNRHNPSRDIAVGFSVREHMLSQEVAMDQTMNGGYLYTI